MGVGRTSSTGLPWLVASSDLTNGSDIIYPTSVAGTGVTLLGGQVSFSGATSVSVNGCFTNSYSHYRIYADYTASSSAVLTCRFRASGTDNSTAVYQVRGSDITSTLAGIALNDQTSAAITTAQTGGNALVFDCINPQATKYTQCPFTSDSSLVSVSDLMRTGTFTHLAAISFDGFSLNMASGSITGNLRIYGMRNY